MIDDSVAELIERKLIESTRALGHVPTLAELAQATDIAPGRLRLKLRQIQSSLKSNNKTLDRHAFFAAINTILDAAPVFQASDVIDGQLADLSRFKTIKDAGKDDSLPKQEQADEDLPDQNTVALLAGDLREVLGQLSPRERDVLRLRFGLDDGRQRTLEEVAKVYGVSRERIRKVEAEALRKLRRPGPPRKPGQ